MLDEISRRIWSRPEFHREYRELIRANAQLALGIVNSSNEIDNSTIARLLQCAVHFAATDNLLFRHAAYEISVSAWNCTHQKPIGLASILECVFSRLGNFAASAHLNTHRNERNALGGLPLGLWFESESHRERNSIKVLSGETLILTDFQSSLWETLSQRVSTAVVAPTSAGKSYALQHFVAFAASSSADSIVYVVPTRALITQVSAAMEQIFKAAGLSKRAVSTVPVPPKEVDEEKLLYVLTQERLQLLLDADHSLRFSLIAIDEAHLISDSARGVLLQHVVERTISRQNNAQLLFVSPFISNPEIFKETFELAEFSKAVSHEPSVSQHLVFVDRTDRDGEVLIKAQLGGDLISLGQRQFSEPLYPPKNMLSFLSWSFGRGQQNLVYTSGPAECEEIARKIADLEAEACAKENKKRTSPALSAFARFLRDQIHPDFLLAQTIEHGVAFHYGNMPSVVRTGIEDLFSEGEIDFLVCTSTLLHGVNFPARNLFLLNPTKGKNTPIAAVDFWNLAGRAGRMGKEFEGFVYLLDHGSWKIDPTKGERTQEIQPALYSAIEDRQRELVDFIRDERHRSGVDPELENTYARLYEAYRNEQLDHVLSMPRRSLDAMQVDEIESALHEVSEKLSLPIAVVDKNPTISPTRQQTLYDFIDATLEKGGDAGLIPIHPLNSSHANPYKRLSDIFKWIHVHLEGRPEKDGSHTYFALMALRWMQGHSLAEMILSAYQQKVSKRKRGVPMIGTVIRDVFSLIENDLRFRYVKFAKCYIDLLVYAMRAKDRLALLEQIPPLPLFLELGASSQTMVSLISIGLSRTTASLLAAKAPRSRMDRLEVVKWLERQTSLSALGLPDVCVRELQKVL